MGVDIFGDTPFIARIVVSWPGVKCEKGWVGAYGPTCDISLFYFKSNADALKIKKTFYEVAEQFDTSNPRITIKGNIMVPSATNYITETFEKMARTKTISPVTFEKKLFLEHGYLLQNQIVTAEDFIVRLGFANGSELEAPTQVITDVDCNTQSTGKTIATVKFRYCDTEYTIQKEFEVIDETHKHYFILENHLRLKELGYKFGRSTYETCILYDESVFNYSLKWSSSTIQIGNAGVKILAEKIGHYSEGMLAKTFNDAPSDDDTVRGGFMVIYFDTDEHAEQYYEIYKNESNIILDGKIAYVDTDNVPWALAIKKAVEKNKYVEPKEYKITVSCREGATFTEDWDYKDRNNYVVTLTYKVDDETIPGGEGAWYNVEVTNVERFETYVSVTVTYKNLSATIKIPENNQSACINR